MACYLFLQYPLFGTRSHFKTLPKFAQIPDGWRHTRSSIDFLITGPIFFKLSDPFYFRNGPAVFAWTKSIIFYITFYIRSKCRNTPIFTHLAPVTSQIWASVKHTQNSNEENFVKTYYLFMRFFFVRPEIESTMQLSNKNRG